MSRLALSRLLFSPQVNLRNHRAARRTAETILRKFLKTESRVKTQGLRAGGYELPGRGHVLQQSTFAALKQLAIMSEESKGARLGLQSDNARGKLAKIVPSPTHVRLVLGRLARYEAADSAIRISLPGFAGSNTMRTRACRASATRRSILRE